MGRISTIAQYLDSVSEAWIGWRVPPPQRAIAEADWWPDLPGEYCRRCGSTVGPGEVGPGEVADTSSGCADCRGGPGIGDGVVRLGRHDAELREWILSIKYGRWVAMGELLGRSLGEAVAQAGLVDPERTVVVPMPMPWQRRMYRGIDHAGVISGGVARVLDAPMAAMLRRSNGPPLVSLTASQRKAMAGRGLRIARRWGGWPVKDLHLLIVDDVRTTGSSLRAAMRLLKALGPDRQVAAVVAVADESLRRSGGMAGGRDLSAPQGARVAMSAGGEYT